MPNKNFLIIIQSCMPGYITIERCSTDSVSSRRLLGFSLQLCLRSNQILFHLISRDDCGVIALLLPLLLVNRLTYEQLRFAIRISDMLNGREFKHKSLTLMARRERQTIGYALVFLQFLEKLKEWEGTEVITLGEEHEPALRLVTDTYAAA